jgi:polysaccharide biosynthesis transport protein
MAADGTSPRIATNVASTRGLPEVIWRRRWSVLGVLALCVGAAGLYLLHTKATFTSEARVYVQQRAPTIISQEDGVVTNSDSYLYLEGEVIKSTSLLDRVANTLESEDLPSLKGVSEPVRYLQSHLVVELDTHYSILDLKYTSGAPLDAVRVLNAILDEYVATHADPSRSNSNKLLEILKSDQEKQAEHLKAAEDDLSKFRKQNVSISMGGTDQTNPVLSDLTKFSNSLADAEVDEIHAAVAYQSALALRDRPDLLWSEMQANPIGNDPDIVRAGSMAGTVQELRMQLDIDSANFGPKHPTVEADRQRLAIATRGLDELNDQIATNYITMLKQRYDHTLLEVSQYKTYFDKQQSLAITLNDVQLQEKALESRVEQEQKLADVLDTRLRSMEVDEGAGVLNITILQEGDGRNLDIRPHPHMVLAMSGVAGLTMGILCAVLLHMLDRSVHNSDEVRAGLRVRVLGAIPHASGSSSIASTGRRLDLDPSSDFAEAFRIVLATIQLGSPEKATRAIMVTSPNQSDGKSTVASNLAIALAETGRRTLLIDLDLRNPQQHMVYSLNNKVGFSSPTRGENKTPIRVQTTGIERLHLLPAGPAPANPAELLASEWCRRILTDAYRKYDSIVIDTPAVLPLADALIVASLRLSTVVVMRAGKCTLKDGEEALERLYSAGASVLGVVVNDVATSKVGKYQYGMPRRGQEPQRLRALGAYPALAPSEPPVVAPDDANHGPMNGNGNANGNGHGNGNVEVNPDIAVTSDNNGNSSPVEAKPED